MRQAEKLIEAVRAHPFLYDQSLQTFKHFGTVGTKNRDWIAVAQTVYGREDRATVNRVKIKWKSLRDAFVKHQRKRQSATSKVRPYIYEDEMRFLLPHIHSRNRDDHVTDSENAPVLKVDVKTEETASFSEDSVLPPDDDPPVVEDFVWDEPQNDEKLINPVDAFFHGIAQTVKQLKPTTVARVKKAVANLVMDAEIEELERKGAE